MGLPRISSWVVRLGSMYSSFHFGGASCASKQKIWQERVTSTSISGGTSTGDEDDAQTDVAEQVQMPCKKK